MSEALQRPRAKAKAPTEVYTWCGNFWPPIEAPAFKAAWDALAVKLGHTPDALELVEAARDKKHVLHGCFNWNVEAAAKAYWLNQAREYIRHLRITYLQGPVRDIPMRALFQVKIDGQRTYIESGLALSQPDFRTQVMREALRDLRAFTSKYMTFLTAIGATLQATALDAAIEQAMADGP